MQDTGANFMAVKDYTFKLQLGFSDLSTVSSLIRLAKICKLLDLSLGLIR